MKNKTLISREHRSKYCNPNSPRHCGHYVSPIPDANSSIYDGDLQAFEKNLSQREEEYLIDLKFFFEGVEKYKKFKFELDEFANQLKQPIFSLEGTEKQLHDIQKMLDDRANKAELIKSCPEPIDNSDEEQSVIEIENEIAQLEKLLESPMSETAISVTKMLSDAQEIEINNKKFSEELEQRKIQIKEQGIKLIDEDKNIEILENEEKEMYQIYLKDKAILDSLPKLDLENILRQERLKEDLIARKQKTIINSRNLQINTSNANEEIEKLQLEIRNLEDEFMIIKERRKSINIVLSNIHDINQLNIQLAKSLKETDEAFNQYKHSYENQRNDLSSIEKKKENLIKMLNIDNTTKKMLNEKDQMIKCRREELDKIEYGFTLEHEKLDEMKKRISEMDKEVEKYEKKAKSMMDKVNAVQEEIQEKEIEIIESSSTSSMKDLKDLINDNIDSL